MQNSFVELNGRERARALLDEGTFRELLGPLDQIQSPHLEPQGIVPQSDDGIILALGEIRKQKVLIISMEGAFQGGGIGEVSGAKISGALELALEVNKNGNKLYPIMIFDTGGVRLQEANYGLLSISEIATQIVGLRKYVPVIGLIPGRVGAFGGMSITAELFTTLIATKKARLGLNGPEVIEQEAGVMEFDSSDKALIWNTIGVNQRFQTGLIDEVVEDTTDAVIEAIDTALKAPAKPAKTEQIDFYLTLLSNLDPTEPWTPERYREFYKQIQPVQQPVPLAKEGAADISDSRGYRWFSRLTGIAHPVSDVPSVLAADVEKNGQLCRYVAIVPDASNRFPRVRNGEVGMLEGWTVAQVIKDAIRQDEKKETKRPIIAIIDVPSQAYGYKEEMVGISLALAASADAYATARLEGHPVIGVIVGNAISGGFLAHGLQSNRLIALDDSKVNIQAMSKASAARITKRTIAELEEATKKVPAMAYDVRSYSTLGALYSLLSGIQADDPQNSDVAIVERTISEAIESTKGAPRDLSFRLQTKEALAGGRTATNNVRQALSEQW
ncbi:biotin-independent malonate decarboxylase subunit beta [Paenibacillus kribbensis]|uniref:biotin-independent malonate decarboxylase subunit beta n=1 Tax=Paenibacillus kribbensis TaxID=172713 RepID=UPI002DBB43F1|nr:biotin-independent malonate decarboxylase subunit beta [Paenibacillus kribbensis]MEC0234208.1 biotin-independent malonate decarboxylase subunit beta [Paenibacillus kribbensis]